MPDVLVYLLQRSIFFPFAMAKLIKSVAWDAVLAVEIARISHFGNTIDLSPKKKPSFLWLINYEVETRGFTAFISESLLQPLVAMPGGMDRGMLVQHLNEMLKCIWQHLLRRIDFARRLTDNPIELSAREEHPVKAIGWAARDQSGVLSPFKFSRRATGINDVTFKVLYCGIGHTDLHLIKNDWGMSKYPLVPGHEIVGIVTKVGSKVQKFKVGDKVGVGCMVGACHSCNNCARNLENYCPKMLLTYNSTYYDGTTTYGGYSDIMVANEHFVIRWPDNLPFDVGAPLLCAGITIYSPLKYFGLNKPDMHVGVVGLGGLGHLAVKFAKAFRVKVTVISTSPRKKSEAIEHLGADSFLISTNLDQMQAASVTLDGIIDTVSAVHPLLPLLNLLKCDGKLVLVGAPGKPLELPVFPLLSGRKIVAGSAIGGIKETQEMIDFAAKHKITADVEVIPIDYVNMAMERLAKADVKYRFVIDIGKTLKDA